MHSRRRQGHGIGARISGERDGLFHTPSIPDLGVQSYSINMVKPEKYGLPFLTLPVPLRLPLLLFVLSTQRQYDAECPTLGKRWIAPVSSVSVWANIVPIPGTVSNCSYVGV